jgi:hypothetical protein
MKVIFFPLKFIQTEEKLKELEKMQEQLHFMRAEYLQSQKYRSPFYARIAHDRYIKAVKDMIKVIKNDKT